MQSTRHQHKLQNSSAFPYKLLESETTKDLDKANEV